MRTSVDDPNNPPEIVTTSGDISDYQAVDNTPGMWSVIWGLIIKLWWIVFIVLGLAAIVLPYLFPQWAESYKKQLSEMGIAANTNQFIRNARAVNWKDAFDKVNFDNLRLVGTGRHKQFKVMPGLKNGAWYTGQVFMMKGYVSEADWFKYSEGMDEEEVNQMMLVPVTEVDQADAQSYCQAQGGRLPSWEELSLAYYFAFTKNWQGKTGEFLKPNLIFEIDNKHALWTNTAEGSGFLKGDNFRIFTPGLADERYEDDGFESAKISFLCVKDEVKK